MSNPILIAVPPHLVQAVAELIANDGAVVAPPTSAELVHGWTEETLRAHYRDSSEKMRAFLVLLAENADTEVNSPEAAKAIGYPDWNSIAGMLGAAGRRAKNHFDREHGPWNSRWGSDDQVRLKMPSAAAAIVLDEAAKQGDR